MGNNKCREAQPGEATARAVSARGRKAKNAVVTGAENPHLKEPVDPKDRFPEAPCLAAGESAEPATLEAEEDDFFLKYYGIRLLSPAPKARPGAKGKTGEAVNTERTT